MCLMVQGSAPTKRLRYGVLPGTTTKRIELATRPAPIELLVALRRGLVGPHSRAAHSLLPALVLSFVSERVQPRQSAASFGGGPLMNPSTSRMKRSTTPSTMSRPQLTMCVAALGRARIEGQSQIVELHMTSRHYAKTWAILVTVAIVGIVAWVYARQAPGLRPPAHPWSAIALLTLSLGALAMPSKDRTQLALKLAVSVAAVVAAVLWARASL